MNIVAPLARTVALPAVDEVTANGPSSEPAGPLADDGVIVNVGGGGDTSGPAAMTWATMPATVSCNGLLVLSTYLSLKNQIAACTAAAFWLTSVRDAGAVVVG